MVTSASKFPRREAAKKASTTSCWRRRSSERTSSLPGRAGEPGWPAVERRQETGRRSARCLERHREEVVEHEREALRRSERLKQNQQGRADRVGEDRLFFGADERELELALVRSSSSSCWLRRERSIPRHTRDTTVVSHPPRLSMLSASERFRRIQVSCTASSAAVREPSMR